MVQTNHRLIMSGLLEGWDWFDNGLQNVLREAGFRPLNKSQSMMVLYISAGVRRPIEIARKMRLSRQAIRHIANQLIDLDVIASRDDDGDGRSSTWSFPSTRRICELQPRPPSTSSKRCCGPVLAGRISKFCAAYSVAIGARR